MIILRNTYALKNSLYENSVDEQRLKFQSFVELTKPGQNKEEAHKRRAFSKKKENNTQKQKQQKVNTVEASIELLKQQFFSDVVDFGIGFSELH